MIRATWLLHRTAVLSLLGIAAVVCTALVLDGFGAGAPYASTAKSAEATAESPTFAFNVKHALQAVLVALPCLLGVFGAAPLLGQEAELGTLRLAWTQSATRGRWTLVTLGLTLGAAAAAAAVVAGAASWWAGQWAPWDDSGMWGEFDRLGPAFVAYSAFAVAAGLALAAVTGRTLPAMILTLFAYIGPRLLVEVALRPLYQPASMFWLFQGIEAAIFLACAAILMAVAAWWLTRRFA